MPQPPINPAIQQLQQTLTPVPSHKPVPKVPQQNMPNQQADRISTPWSPDYRALMAEKQAIPAQMAALDAKYQGLPLPIKALVEILTGGK